MKKLLIIAFTFCSLLTSAQLNVPQVANVNPVVSQNDSVIKVSYINRTNAEKSPAYYVNGQFVNESILKSLNPEGIEYIRVEKEEIEVESQKYYGQIFISTKVSYKPKLISLTDLKLKYTKLKNTPAIFMIDNEIVQDDSNKFLVDENYILNISIENIDRAKEKLNFYLIHIFTKSEENIRNSKKIILRGN